MMAGSRDNDDSIGLVGARRTGKTAAAMKAAEKNVDALAKKAKVKSQVKAKPRTRGLAAEEDGEADVGVKAQILDGDGDGYHDQESEWEDARYNANEESEALGVFTDFTGGEKGISGKTDLTQHQVVFLWHLRGLAKSYPELELDDDVEESAELFETYRISLNRGSRKEAVDLFRGKMELGKKQQDDGSPLKF